MKVVLIGAGGAIGKIITPAIKQKHEIITAGRSGGDVTVDISSATSIENLFKQVNNIDAVVCATGDSITCHLSVLTEENVYVGIKQKLLAQINLVLIGQNYLNNNGSFTLVSGKMGDKPGKRFSRQVRSEWWYQQFCIGCCFGNAPWYQGKCGKPFKGC